MNALAFDTHAVANALEEAGFTRPQVEALVDVSRRTSLFPDVTTLATKDDVSQLRSEMAILKAELRGEMSASKVQIIGILASLMTILAVASTLLGKLIH